ncbi:MAG: ribulose-phosphate 3-epimerase [Bacillota bacterium]
MVEFAPSLLASDFSNLREEVKKVDNADYLHLDVMDGHFVPNLTFGPKLIGDLRKHSDLKFDTHLMIDNPEKYINTYAEAGSDLITIHEETSKHTHRLIQQIKNTGCRAGIALNPATPIDNLEYVLPELDLVLIMSVNPGFGGQSFIPQILVKIERLATVIEKRGLDLKIAVDGGINENNIIDVVRSGADIIVAGSAIFKTNNPTRTIENFRKKVNLEEGKKDLST